jgi:hypothetical protein
MPLHMEPCLLEFSDVVAYCFRSLAHLSLSLIPDGNTGAPVMYPHRQHTHLMHSTRSFHPWVGVPPACGFSRATLLPDTECNFSVSSTGFITDTFVRLA